MLVQSLSHLPLGKSQWQMDGQATSPSQGHLYTYRHFRITISLKCLSPEWRMELEYRVNPHCDNRDTGRPQPACRFELITFLLWENSANQPCATLISMTALFLQTLAWCCNIFWHSCTLKHCLLIGHRKSSYGSIVLTDTGLLDVLDVEI